LFDPTIFDNVKVVIEGAVYDRDLEGEIKVVSRDDLINLANMSREYTISFKLSDGSSSSCKWSLSSNVRQLSSELLNMYDKSEQGCITKIEFFLSIEMIDKAFEIILNLLSKEWSGRKITLQLQSPWPVGKIVQLKAIVQFDRIIIEDDIDDLVEMVQYMINTLRILEKNGY
jgi:hypothetical protein